MSTLHLPTHGPGPVQPEPRDAQTQDFGPAGALAETAVALDPASSAVPADNSTYRAKKSLPRAVASWALNIFMILALLVVLVLVAIPALNHGTILAVLTGSMQPSINPGDVIAVRSIDGFDGIKEGDVISFQPNPLDATMISHRVVGWTTSDKGERLVITQGDANSAPDQPIHDYQVRGKMMYRVPWVGKITTQWTSVQKPLFWIIPCLALIVVGTWRWFVATRTREGLPKGRIPEDSDSGHGDGPASHRAN